MVDSWLWKRSENLWFGKRTIRVTSWSLSESMLLLQQLWRNKRDTYIFDLLAVKEQIWEMKISGSY